MQGYQAGDILLFSGRDPVSRWIKLWTLSKFSHVGIVAEVDEATIGRAKSDGVKLPSPMPVLPRHLVFESTTLMESPCLITGESINGVQAHDPYSRVIGYPGKVWRMRLTKDFALDPYEKRHMATSLLRYIGTDYDTKGAVKSGSRWLKEKFWPNPDLRTVFCSEYVARSLQVVGRLPLLNPSGLTPGGLYKRLKKSGVYQPTLEPVWTQEATK